MCRATTQIHIAAMTMACYNIVTQGWHFTCDTTRVTNVCASIGESSYLFNKCQELNQIQIGSILLSTFSHRKEQKLKVLTYTATKRGQYPERER